MACHGIRDLQIGSMDFVSGVTADLEAIRAAQELPCMALSTHKLSLCGMPRHAKLQVSLMFTRDVLQICKPHKLFKSWHTLHSSTKQVGVLWHGLSCGPVEQLKALQQRLWHRSDVLSIPHKEDHPPVLPRPEKSSSFRILPCKAQKARNTLDPTS